MSCALLKSHGLGRMGDQTLGALGGLCYGGRGLSESEAWICLPAKLLISSLNHN